MMVSSTAAFTWLSAERKLLSKLVSRPWVKTDSWVSKRVRSFTFLSTAPMIPSHPFGVRCPYLFSGSFFTVYSKPTVLDSSSMRSMMYPRYSGLLVFLRFPCLSYFSTGITYGSTCNKKWRPGMIWVVYGIAIGRLLADCGYRWSVKATRLQQQASNLTKDPFFHHTTQGNHLFPGTNRDHNCCWIKTRRELAQAI